MSEKRIINAFTFRSVILLIPISFLFMQRANCQDQVKTRKKVDGKMYHLKFSDEFNGTDLDKDKWVYRTDSKHWSTQLPANVDLNNGFLRLNLKKEKCQDKDYTGAGVISANAFHYGYYETRMKVPEGDGWHTSFWLMQHDGQGGTGVSKATIEIDICENDSKNPDGYSFNLHRWKGEHIDMAKHISTPPLDEDFHVIACAYTSDYIKFYFDQKEVRTIDLNELDLHLGSLNIWLTSIASFLGGTEAVEENELPGTAVFDYVRFYELKE